MCGIFGYYNFNCPRDRAYVLDALHTGLKRLEYRGYDSAGLCIDGDEIANNCPVRPIKNGLVDHCIVENGQLLSPMEFKGEDGKMQPLLAKIPLVVKSVGKIDDLIAQCKNDLKEVDMAKEYNAHCGIAHTRWATHGAPCTVNSHPHVSSDDNAFVVVHNGIITNYQALKGFLTNHGYAFYSETDTEVIPKLCQYVWDTMTTKIPFSELVMEVMKQLDGAFSLLIKSTYYPGEMVACKRGSPLIMGIKETPKSTILMQRTSEARSKRHAQESLECYIASDASAVVEHTKQVVYLEDNDILHVVGCAYGIFNTSMQKTTVAVSRSIQKLEMEVAQIMKGGYDHFMKKEIHEQPDSVIQSLRGRIRFGEVMNGKEAHKRIKLGGLVDHLDHIKRCRRIIFVACGTSYHACLAARGIMEEMTNLPVCLEMASDLMDRKCPLFRDDVGIFTSQSGETADTLNALRYAKAQGTLCVGITNTVGSAIARETHCGVHVNAGAEIGVASTKAYTCQIVVTVLVALALADDSIYKLERKEQVIQSLEVLPEKLREVLKLDSEMVELAKELKGENSLLLFGRGNNYATALEAALKVKEVALMHSEGILAGEMKHGPLALVDKTLPIIVMATRDQMHGKMHSVIQQLLAREANLIVFVTEDDEEVPILKSAGCRVYEVPYVEDCLQPIVNIVPLQLLSYHLTCLRGHNVDQPRNLAKSVTVTED
mmetsp:Transcript_5302/g.14779  ORF Transcript_5302/g.14779 Transcript_5302/m.14779 type:complete len:713 (-) Transcript_5302:38-2176(-)|eukprot:CAMPEP_0117651380 /NCGR_PEP_ID=MMETSP0804-20121206/2061_1 /TAXON_ID=1074897 /ORGANISM="Tetraselmis astigmatica, Strain CCMP880" /LENGTH=712 /DNA_ID=CAMNT_0005457353 /DNA_START=77 /DNA_END=2215 /DNA_ORIENTATION=+